MPMLSRHRSRRWVPVALVVSLLVCLRPAWARDADIELGGPGVGQGKFARVRDLAFDGANNLYVLDGGPFKARDRRIEGNFLVQKFDPRGRFLAQFLVFDPKLGQGNDPARLALDGKGNVYVTQPKAGLVQRVSPEGRLLDSLEIPHAFAVAVQKVGGRERILVAPQPGRGGGEPIGELEVIDPVGMVGRPLRLTRKLTRCRDLACDGAGNIYAQAEANQVHKFDPNGKHLLSLGAGTSTRREDGSELLGCVAVDSQGSIYSMAWASQAKFDAAITTVARRQGRFTWYDAWGHGTVLAVDRHDRLWAATAGYDNGKGRYHARPAVLRAVADFFEKGADVGSTLLLGLNVQAKPRLPYHIAYEPGEATVDFVVGKGVRRVRQIAVAWQAVDLHKTRVAHGQFDLALADGVEARRAVRVRLPRFGWYTVEFQVSARGTRLTGIGTHIGVTPRYDGMPTLAEGAAKGGWEDPLRQAFCGLTLLRAHPRPGQLDKLDALVKQCDAHGVTLLAQFTGKKEATEAFVREAVTRFKGRIRYWELINEPNFAFAPKDYVALCKKLYPLIHTIDPSAKVLAPAVCGVQLPWYEAFYKLGGGTRCDILSVHDYEGHESADHHHWPRKFADLRALMARHGDADKPIWQTERGIPGVRAGCFLGPAQAVRVLLHRNLLASLGVPSAHSKYYYLNQGGYGAYPAYLWSETGPHPAALALRTRHAMLRGHALAGRLGFGPAGDRMLLGLRYTGRGGSTIVLQNLGTLPVPLRLRVTGHGPLELVDAFGNRRDVAVREGQATLDVPSMPVYLRLGARQAVEPVELDFGRNLAPMAAFAWSGKTKHGDMSVLTDGAFQSPHFGYPSQYKYFEGQIESFPQYLDVAFPHPRTVNRVVVHSLRADNMQTALLDFDVQARLGDAWHTLRQVRTAVPASTPVVSRHCKANTWYLDTNFHACAFEPVTASRFRLVVRQTTRGLLPDAEAERITGKSFGPRLHLREIEMHGPPPAVALALTGNRALRTGAFEREEIGVAVTSRGPTLRAKAVVKPPAGWRASPGELPLSVAPDRAAKATFSLAAPKQIPVGAIPIDVELRGRDGILLDFDRLTLRFASPVEIAPRTPARIDQAAQPMPVEIKNVSDADVRGTVRLRVAGVEAGQGALDAVEKAFGPVKPGQSVTVALAVPKLRLVGQAWRAEYAVVVNGLVARKQQALEPVQLWHVLGPFTNDEKNSAFAQVLPPEKGVDLSAEHAVHGGAKARWRPVPTDARGYLELARIWQKRTFACAYAVAWIHSPSERDAALSVGWDDGLKMWLNGRLVHEHESLSHGAKRGDVRKPVRLREGWNEILMKVTQGHGGWGFYLDVLGPGGTALENVTIAPRPSR